MSHKIKFDELKEELTKAITEFQSRQKDQNQVFNKLNTGLKNATESTKSQQLNHKKTFDELKEELTKSIAEFEARQKDQDEEFRQLNSGA